MNKPPDQRCSYCEFPSTARCGGCQVIPYCCGDCQRADWFSHKPFCKALKQYPPPRGFIPTFNPCSLINLTKLSAASGRPVYPTPWALEKSMDGEFPTPVDKSMEPDELTDKLVSRIKSIHGREGMERWKVLLGQQRGKEIQKAVLSAGNNHWGLGDRFECMKVLDAYRMYCYESMKLHSGKESLIKVYTPSEAGLRDYFLPPLILRMSSTHSHLTTPFYPARSPTEESAFQTSLARIFAELVDAAAAYPEASFDRPVTEDEHDSLMIFGYPKALDKICQAVRDGLKLDEELKWIIEAEGDGPGWEDREEREDQ